MDYKIIMVYGRRNLYLILVTYVRASIASRGSSEPRKGGSFDHTNGALENWCYCTVRIPYSTIMRKSIVSVPQPTVFSMPSLPGQPVEAMYLLISNGILYMVFY